MLALFIVAAAARGDEAQAPRPPRRYSGNVTLHAPPDVAKPPTPATNRVSDRIWDSKGTAPLDSGFQEMTRPVPNNAPRPPPRNLQQNAKKDDDWMADALRGKDEKADKEKKPSGWGWLADDVLTATARKDKEKVDESEEGSETSSTGVVISARSILREDDRIGATAYQPVLGSRLAESRDTPEQDDTSREKPQAAADQPIVKVEDYLSREWIPDAKSDFGAGIGGSQEALGGPPRLGLGESLGDLQGTPAETPTKERSLFSTPPVGAGFAPAIGAPTDVSSKSLFANPSPFGSLPSESAASSPRTPSLSWETTPAYNPTPTPSLFSRPSAPGLSSALGPPKFDEIERKRALPW